MLHKLQFKVKCQNTHFNNIHNKLQIQIEYHYHYSNVCIICKFKLGQSNDQHYFGTKDYNSGNSILNKQIGRYNIIQSYGHKSTLDIWLSHLSVLIFVKQQIIHEQIITKMTQFTTNQKYMHAN